MPMLRARSILPFALIGLIAFPLTRDAALTALSDGFFQVSVFVFATLFVYYTLVDAFPDMDVANLAKKKPWAELPMAAFLGALPGCGGAIIVMTQYSRGSVSFGAVIATLTATMGDAAFLLLARAPETALLLLSIGALVGVVSGALVNLIHPRDHLCPYQEYRDDALCYHLGDTITRVGGRFWQWLIVPAFICALFVAVQFEFNPLQAELILVIGAGAALLILFIWAFTSPGNSYRQIAGEDYCDKGQSRFVKAMLDTHFITSWVVLAFLLFELSTLFGVDLGQTFNQAAVWMPLIAVGIGLLPGCGPQLVVTSLYLSGHISLAALFANAIANDGDALFPAIALAPKAAIIASLYTSIPALLVGYGLYIWL